MTAPPNGEVCDVFRGPQEGPLQIHRKYKTVAISGPLRFPQPIVHNISQYARGPLDTRVRH